MLCFVCLRPVSCVSNVANVSELSIIDCPFWFSLVFNQRRIGGVMVSVLASRAVDRGFELRSCQRKEYKIDICCFNTKHAALRRKSKDLLTRNQNNMSERGDMSNHAKCCFSELAL